MHTHHCCVSTAPLPATSYCPSQGLCHQDAICHCVSHRLASCHKAKIFLADIDGGQSKGRSPKRSKCGHYRVHKPLITTRFGCATVTSYCCASSVRADWYWQISTCELELRECNLKGTGFLPAAGLGAPIRQTAGKLHAPQGDLKATFPCEDNTSWEHTCWFVYCMHITRVICQYKCTVRQRSRVLFSLVPSL